MKSVHVTCIVTWAVHTLNFNNVILSEMNINSELKKMCSGKIKKDTSAAYKSYDDDTTVIIN